MPEYQNWVKEIAYQDFYDSNMDHVIRERLGLSSGETSSVIRRLGNGEKNYYDDISDVPANVKAAASIGSYKMSYKLLHKLISKRLMVDGKTDMYGASNSCICTVIYLCTLCDETGLVEDFRIQDLVGKTCVSERGAYYVLSKLEEKGIIQINCYCKNGYRDIILIDNDFSDFHKKDRYLNMNRTFFNVNDTSEFGFSAFRKLSLFAKKLLLYTLFEYDAQRGRHGYHSYMYKLAEKLGLKNIDLIQGYVEEISSMCPLSFLETLTGARGPVYTYHSKEGGSRKKIFAIRPKSMDITGQMAEDAPTCLKYKVSSLFKSTGVPVVFEDGNTFYNLEPQSGEYTRIIHELSNIVVWNSVRYKDSPVVVLDLLKQLEKFILLFKYFSLEQVDMFRIYINEFMCLSRQIITPGFVLA